MVNLSGAPVSRCVSCVCNKCFQVITSQLITGGKRTPAGSGATASTCHCNYGHCCTIMLSHCTLFSILSLLCISHCQQTEIKNWTCHYCTHTEPSVLFMTTYFNFQKTKGRNYNNCLIHLIFLNYPMIMNLLQKNKNTKDLHLEAEVAERCPSLAFY